MRIIGVHRARGEGRGVGNQIRRSWVARIGQKRGVQRVVGGGKPVPHLKLQETLADHKRGEVHLGVRRYGVDNSREVFDPIDRDGIDRPGGLDAGLEDGPGRARPCWRLETLRPLLIAKVAPVMVTGSEKDTVTVSKVSLPTADVTVGANSVRVNGQNGVVGGDIAPQVGDLDVELGAVERRGHVIQGQRCIRCVGQSHLVATP